ncbi:polyhydroxyalkanoic acid system family protein [Paraferrimonas sedimenticola]|uniref:Polyhydroxyalkanoic acid system protein n=1 Tax=Paraferrimonas sedimenticola TaxID=375674 RepID=A0AA37RVW3_9GAMM|nr:polyhydroxyalkanoic acid system family protein [Paraferrimonas sedimenticola]GLP95883.1 hypothetical protein GCM10007895_11890 [Paraferrimonas sedimenticola]
MAQINIQRSHRLEAQQLRDLSEQMAHSLQTRYQLDWYWRGEQLHFERSGAKGVLTAAADSLNITLKLGLFYRPLAAQIQRAIEDKLDEMLSL